MDTLFGGSSGDTSQQNTSQSGFSLLPQSIQSAFTGLANNATGTLTPGGTPASSLYTLPGLNGASQNALGQIQNQNFAVTPQSIQSGISEQMNPYNQSVINQIQTAQNGNLSQLNSYLSNAGQFGSNRGALGANDIAMQDANQVGGFLNGEYNTALGNSLTTIPGVNAQSAAGSVGAGQLQQSQAMQNQQAPVSALAALAQLLGSLPQTGGSTSQGSGSAQSSSVSGGGLFGGAGGTGIGNILGTAGSILSFL